MAIDSDNIYKFQYGSFFSQKYAALILQTNCNSNLNLNEVLAYHYILNVCLN